jgi:hypothetical protein
MFSREAMWTIFCMNTKGTQANEDVGTDAYHYQT